MLDTPTLLLRFPPEQVERLQALLGDPGWRGALTILTSNIFAGDGRVWGCVNLQKESIDFPAILSDGTFSGGEARLLKIAASLFSQDVAVNLWEVFGSLDEEGTLLALQAMAAFSNKLGST